MKHYRFSILIATLSGIIFLAITFLLSLYINWWSYAVSIPVFITLQVLAYKVYDKESYND